MKRNTYLNNLRWRKNVENPEQHELSNMTELWFGIPFSNKFKQKTKLILAKAMKSFIYLTLSISLPAEDPAKGSKHHKEKGKEGRRETSGEVPNLQSSANIAKSLWGLRSSNAICIALM